MRIEELAVEPDGGALLIHLRDGWHVPAGFVVDAKLGEPSCRVRLIVVMETAEPVCVELTVTPLNTGAGVRSTDLRAIAMRELMVIAAAKLASRRVEGVAAQVLALHESMVRVEVDAATGEIGFVPSLETKLAARAAVSRRRINDDLLKTVSSIYREANEAGANPARAVADEMNYSRSHARRLVQMARERGFLQPTTERRKGG